ncbi:cupin domain-containing protein [Kocuria turfanensis]|uniref:Cupin 2 conserved barrel domain-containing protein n=1 Tax=Kocuria turfanensis TaxID=388357 RepID=A0A512IAH9_9MICC|nr:hypothetical protein [Kocuria turfanensis]GEO94715.1 hypothetical protein KTU01_08380 [Kocuria turfanensis]
MRPTQAEIDELLATCTTHRNTFLGDAVTFLRTSAGTSGECTLVHLVAEPGAGVPRRHPLHSAEHFEVLEGGALTVEIARKPHAVLPGEDATAPVDAVHLWANQGSSTVEELALRVRARHPQATRLPFIGDDVDDSRYPAEITDHSDRPLDTGGPPPDDRTATQMPGNLRT